VDRHNILQPFLRVLRGTQGELEMRIDQMLCVVDGCAI
jgi:hypothetical protein